MRVAIIGSGVAGLMNALLLSKEHEVDLYEANHYAGGHVNTVDVTASSGEKLAIDTGFIVFNNQTYPNFVNVLSKLNVPSISTTMSFSIQDQLTGLEYQSASASGFFAQRRNMLRYQHYLLLKEIMRFHRIAKHMQHSMADQLAKQTLADFLAEHKFSDDFARQFILPMTAAVWSSSFTNAAQYPMLALINFMHNHGLLGIADAPEWRVIKGGSKCYVQALLAQFKGRLLLNNPVSAVTAMAGQQRVTSAQLEQDYDRVIFACHSDQALALLADPSAAEQDVLAGMRYQYNQAILHTDQSVLPTNKRAWAAWNYRVDGESDGKAKLTYNMNMLQSLQADQVYCVSLNQQEDIDPSKVLRSIDYHHPVYDQQLVNRQQRWAEISGHTQQRFYCGAYWFNGFHEDGVRSALRVCDAFGVQL